MKKVHVVVVPFNPSLPLVCNTGNHMSRAWSARLGLLLQEVEVMVVACNGRSCRGLPERIMGYVI